MGTGAIARAFAESLRETETGSLVAVASRERARAEQFAASLSVPGVHPSYDSLLADPAVDTVYVALPHTLHAEWSIRAAEAGKHVLCEKPAGINRAEASAMIAAAKDNGVFLMEAFMYRCHPQTARLIELIRSGVIGEVRVIKATFSFLSQKRGSRLFDPGLGGGGILDVGCYPVSMARLIAGAAVGKPFADPTEFGGVGVLGAGSGVDEYAVATLKFEGEILATVACGVSLTMENTVRIFGTGGNLVVPSPWLASRTAGFSKIIVFRSNIPDEIVVETDKSIYAIEAEHVAAHLSARQAPAMPWEDTLGNMATLDRWRAAAGMVYPSERIENLSGPAGKRHPIRRGNRPVASGAINGIPRPVSELILTPGSGRTAMDELAILDSYFAQGGNTLCIPQKEMHRVTELVRHWLKTRNVSNEVAIISRSQWLARPTPACFRAALHARRHELENCLDLFVADGDHPDLSPQEIVTALSAEVDAGHCPGYALAGWSSDRVREAVAFAHANKLHRPAAVLARLDLTDDAGEEEQWGRPRTLQWLQLTQLPVIAHPRAADQYGVLSADPRRKAQVELLADRYQTDPRSLALAWTLRQPFPTFALIEPQSPEELKVLFDATRIRLEPPDLASISPAAPPPRGATPSG